MHLRCTLLPILLVSYALQAQDTLQARLNEYAHSDLVWFPEPQDRAEFVAFRSGLKMADPQATTNTTTIRYHQAWSEELRGGLVTVKRGNGNTLEYRAMAAISLLDKMFYPFTSSDGRRGVVMIVEEPCGLVCRSMWYYVEE